MLPRGYTGCSTLQQFQQPYMTLQHFPKFTDVPTDDPEPRVGFPTSILTGLPVSTCWWPGLVSSLTSRHQSPSVPSDSENRALLSASTSPTDLVKVCISHGKFNSNANTTAFPTWRSHADTNSKGTTPQQSWKYFVGGLAISPTTMLRHHLHRNTKEPAHHPLTLRMKVSVAEPTIHSSFRVATSSS